METEKIGFFKRIKLAIFNLEKYNIFAKEPLKNSIKYLLKLLLIVSIILAISATIKAGMMMDKLTNYIKNDLPEFELKEGKLNVNEYVEAFDEEYQAKLIVDTSDDLTDEQIKEYKKSSKEGLFGFVFFKDKVYYTVIDEDLGVDSPGIETTYNNLLENVNVDNVTKNDLVNNYLTNSGLMKIKIGICFYAFISIFVQNILSLIEDIFIVAVFGWVASKIIKVKLALTQNISLSIYSLTLSIIISLIYTVVHAYTDFTIMYFAFMYLVIAYIYMVASIMIMKDDTLKTASDAITVEGEIVKIPEEEEEDKLPEEKPKKKKKETDKEDKENKEEKAKDGEKKSKSKQSK